MKSSTTAPPGISRCSFPRPRSSTPRSVPPPHPGCPLPAPLGGPGLRGANHCARGGAPALPGGGRCGGGRLPGAAALLRAGGRRAPGCAGSGGRGGGECGGSAVPRDGGSRPGPRGWEEAAGPRGDGKRVPLGRAEPGLMLAQLLATVPAFWATFKGVCATTTAIHSPASGPFARLTGGGGGVPPVPPGSAGTPQLKGTGAPSPSLSSPDASPSLSGCSPGSAASPLANKACAAGAAGTSVRGPRKQGRNGGAWLCLVWFSIVNNLPGGGEDVGQTLCPRSFVRLVACEGSCGCARAAVPGGDGLPGLPGLCRR